ncbi:hypothetical protein [Kribbella steppae]|nr:hypothetical protein [Kribbella steppae]
MRLDRRTPPVELHTSAVIKALGKDPSYFAWSPVAWSGPPIFGE